MKRLSPVLFMLVFIVGCASQQDLAAVKWEVDALKTRLAKAEERLKEKDRLTDQGLGQQAELLAGYNELKEQMSSLQGGLEEMKVSSKGVVREERLASIEKEIQSVKALLDARKEPPKSLFETGLEKYRAGRHSEAMADLKSYLAASPDPALADDAQFWIGESLFSLGKYDDALLQYDLVVKRYAKSEKVPESLLKQGMSLYKTGDPEAGGLILQRLVQGYPETDAAGKAKKILKDGLK